MVNNYQCRLTTELTATHQNTVFQCHSLAANLILNRSSLANPQGQHHQCTAITSSVSEKSVGYNNDLINPIVSPLRHRPIWSFSFSHKRENCRKQMTACVATVNHICWNTSFPSDLELLQLQSDHTVQSYSVLGLHHGIKSWNLYCYINITIYCYIVTAILF